MATISLIDLLGTDNVAVSRTDINKNFQTVENSVNTLETYLNTTPAGGALSIGSATLTLGANPIGTNLLVNQGSASIAGNLAVGLDLALTGSANITANASIDGSLTLTGSGITPALTVGSAAIVPFTLQNVIFVETQLANATPINTVHTDGGAGTGLVQIDISSGSGNERKILLDYASFSNGDGTRANFVELTGSATFGQKLWIGIEEVSSDLIPEGIYIALAGFNAKYDDLGLQTPAQLTPDINAAFQFTAATLNGYRRLWVELLYRSDSTWEVIGAHPSINGL